MISENGNISIHTENIFPIIKKWLYSDKDIFIREVISNGCDAINKLKRLSSIGEASVDENEQFKITVAFSKTNKELRFSDNGIGMTAEEIKKYITQVAFSGAEEFINKYKDKIDEGNQIIGHFGLGFYSVFMVSDKVEIDTLSYQNGSEAANWVCSGGTDYTISSSGRTERGTTITLHISSDSEEYLDEFKLREIIKKYCQFMPVEIFLVNEDKEAEKTENDKDKEQVKPEPLNDINPLWLKKPSECKDEDYKDFYRKVFFDFNEPLFWIHLNVDYPFNLKGILYFPKLKNEMDMVEGQVKLYNNQVFVADNIKEVIPDFLLLLKGVIDCPDLPLNVSRSFLQKDSTVMKISRHIVNKVADKLLELFKEDRKKFEGFWKDIHIFIKYGCLRDEKFYDKVKDIIIYKTIDGEYTTLKEFTEKIATSEENKNKKVYYVSDELQQSQYINMFKTNNLNALVLNSTIDNHFISFIEMKESNISFARIDSDVTSELKAEGESISEEDTKALEEIFKNNIKDKKVQFKFDALKTENVPGIILISEQSRRMWEMSKMYGGLENMGFNDEKTLLINKNNNLIKSILANKNNDSKKEALAIACQHIYDLAMLSQNQLSPEAMTEFIARSNALIEKTID
ncbi:molecular chaperone HtpG [Clostridium oryzae]|uniref:Chaperone protein HtpG n=1 Tax=Clostridium oryzae TaxID=1450648 RepID=A0A1V4IRK9_9CLOT|nr:molecular chaperone HtpG [Clostridium oryzae]OPJ62450.1 chaperone protein HtpG [Clostridium oryzae]